MHILLGSALLSVVHTYWQALARTAKCATFVQKPAGISLSCMHTCQLIACRMLFGVAMKMAAAQIRQPAGGVFM